MKRRGLSDSVVITAIVAVALLAALVGAPVAYNLTRPAGGVVVPVPSVSPLSQFRGKSLASEVGKAHRDFAIVLAKHPLQSTGTLKAKLVEFHSLLYSDNAGTLPGFSAAFEQAWVGAFGSDDKPFDAAAAKAFLESVASALGG